ncbi:FdtA/QdtA family cupin domain-containing protein [Wohlfahrtiimonas chitiniclastica]|uniref:sugar 3,4-ketoisomerase n=1 Tax=Wohlfahrtiimonas chitiniclastica TaxID=400946 RepID=UPI0007B40C5F|nr:FdtA/QdtA family cupin domain-containing protein [Wohlfahrtiimonas chitiniclastica]WHR56022.1 FdtA/QdtA family cupin domain-containing protein [Wohlfahrtiimonas chitiniclastica]
MTLINLIDFPVLGDERGSLVALEGMKNIPFDIKRVYYIFGANEQPRGFHAHKKLQQCAIALSGKCRVVMDNGSKKEDVWLDIPNKGLLIKDEWHEMHDFSKDCVLLVLASQYYDEDDYIRNYDKYLEYLL